MVGSRTCAEHQGEGGRAPGPLARGDGEAMRQLLKIFKMPWDYRKNMEEYGRISLGSDTVTNFCSDTALNSEHGKGCECQEPRTSMEKDGLGK